MTAQKLDEISRRGFLAGLAGMAAQGVVPKSVAGILTKELSTPAGAAARLSVPAAMALFQVIKDQLNQYDGEDDTDYYEAWEDMTSNLGFEDGEDAEGYVIGATEQFDKLMNLYQQNPQAAAEALIKHLQAAGIDPNNIKVHPRDDRRYQKRIDRGERLIRGQDGDLGWVSPGDPGYPSQGATDQTARAAATTVARTQAAPAVATSMAAFKDLVQRVVSAGQPEQPRTKDAGKMQFQPTTPALPAPDQSAVAIMAKLRDMVGRDLSTQEKSVVQQELARKTS